METGKKRGPKTDNPKTYKMGIRTCIHSQGVPNFRGIFSSDKAENRRCGMSTARFDNAIRRKKTRKAVIFGYEYRFLN